jgi:hypothetical protein
MTLVDEMIFSINPSINGFFGKSNNDISTNENTTFTPTKYYVGMIQFSDSG